jgi:hypothetical protein
MAIKDMVKGYQARLRISMTRDTYEILAARANQQFGGNLSWAIEEAAQTLGRALGIAGVAKQLGAHGNTLTKLDRQSFAKELRSVVTSQSTKFTKAKVNKAKVNKAKATKRKGTS